MEASVREYDAKLASKKRLTLREAGYEYYHVSVLPDQRIVLEPRVLTAPFEPHPEDKSNGYKKVTLSAMGKETT